VFDRREDVALQKARSTINERIHARLWLTPYTFESRRVWIGQVSRDIGVRLTDQTWNLTTHKIGPDVDFDRAYLLQDLLMSGFVERYGFVEGVGAAAASTPRTNLTGDPYYTDGLRLVVFLSTQTKRLTETARLPWELPSGAGCGSTLSRAAHHGLRARSAVRPCRGMKSLLISLLVAVGVRVPMPRQRAGPTDVCGA
jgi:hypothetical protein